MNKFILSLLLLFVGITAYTQDISQGLIGHWLMNDDEEVIDQSDSELDGVIGGASYTEDRFGNEEEALFFDGQFDYVVYEDALDDVTTDEEATFSISLWHRTSDFIPDLSPLMCKYSHGGCGEAEREWALLIAADEGIRFYYASTPDNVNYRSVSTLDLVAQELETWYHIVVTYDGSTDENDGQDRVQIYVDNVLQTDTLNFSLGELGPAIYDGDAPIALMSYVDTDGDECGDYNAPGALDDIRFYDRVLMESEVDLLFAEGIVDGITENEFEANVAIFPTLVTNSELNINSTQPYQQVDLEILSVTGKKVYSERLGHINGQRIVQLSDLSIGTYILRLTNESGLELVERLVID